MLAATLLALFVLLLFYRLLFTDRALASGDILHYFYPYRDYAAAALRAGRVPLWNPYIFMGAPFLANPQAAALYPLHWPLSWLPVTRQLYWSAAIHTWILALGGYGLMRRWRAGWPAAVCAGLMLAGSGFYGGLIGHINQMNGAAWLPWLLWAVTPAPPVVRPSGQERPTASGKTGHRPLTKVLATAFAARLPKLDRAGHRSLVSNILAFSLFTALTLLAGHTQTTYINLFGVGAWLLAASLIPVTRGLWLVTRKSQRPAGKPATDPRLPALAMIRPPIASFLIYAPGLLLGVLIAAAQLAPTLELSQFGLRSGGLSYVDATSFSLRPLLLHWTLLPSYGLRDLSVVFATLGYTEFVAYVGALGLLLAVTAVASSLWPMRSGQQPHWPRITDNRPLQCGLFFAGLGLFLALGRWNPFSFLFYHLIPGFDLFRTPARWMMLYTLGMATLAGVGMEWIHARITSSRAAGGTRRARLSLPALQFSLLAAVALDLILAARALPHTQPTAPQAVYDVRTASAHLLTEPRRSLHPAAMGRLLSMSEITFDPGDMPDWRRVLRGGARPQLSEPAFTDFIIALKSQEILAPNLSLLWRIPTVDGFDGGVLPLQRYNAFLSLLIPPADLVPDGRVREQLQEIPSTELLELMDVRFLITDKARDVWLEDIYYDRQIGATLSADGLRTVSVDAPRDFQAETVAIVGFVTSETNEPQAVSANLTLAEVTALVDGERIALGRLQTAVKSDEWRVDSNFFSAKAAIRYPLSTVGHTGRQEFLARFPLSQPARLDTLEISLPQEAAPVRLTVQAVTLIDERTRTFAPLLPSDRGPFRRVHSGDVKIYERIGGSGRAQLLGSVRPASSLGEAVTMLRAADAQNADAVVEADAEKVAGWGVADAPAGRGDATLISYAPERVVIRARNAHPAFLVLKDAFYPGWQAAVNGDPVEIYPTNALFRGVPVPAGDNEIIFSYKPRAWRTGLRISAAGGLIWLLLALGAALARRRGRIAVIGNCVVGNCGAGAFPDTGH